MYVESITQKWMRILFGLFSRNRSVLIDALEQHERICRHFINMKQEELDIPKKGEEEDKYLEGKFMRTAAARQFS